MPVTTLALDCAMSGLSLALIRDDKILASDTLLGDRLQSAALLGKIITLLNSAKCTLNDVSQILYGNGPGSFTSLRIGLATLQGLFLSPNSSPVLISCSSLWLRCLSLQNNDEDVSCYLPAGQDRIYFGEIKNGVFSEEARTSGAGSVAAPDPLPTQAFLRVLQNPISCRSSTLADAKINYLSHFA